MFSRIFSGIFGHFFLRAFVIQSALGFAILAVVLSLFNFVSDRMAVEQGRTFANSTLAATIDALYKNEYGNIVDYCMGIMKNTPNIDFIVYSNKNGTELLIKPERWSIEEKSLHYYRLGFELPEWQAYALEDAGRFFNPASSFVFSRPIVIGGQQWGVLSVGFSKKAYFYSILEFYFSVTALGIAAGLISLYLFFISTRRIRSQLADLEGIARKLSEGQLTVHAKESSIGEVGLLGTSINAMSRALKEKSDRLEQLVRVVEQTDDAFVLFDDTRHVIFTNDALVKFTGRPGSFFMGMTLTEFGHLLNLSELERMSQDQLVTQCCDVAVTKMDQSTVDAELRLESISSDKAGIGYLLVVLSDITDRKLAEISLQESEKRFRSLANAAPTLIWVAGADKLCSWFNNTWVSYTGRSLEQEIGNGWTEGIHPDDFTRCLETYTSSFDARLPFSMEYRLRNHQGEYRWFIEVGRPRIDENGNFVGYIGMLTDINDRKMMEQTMRLAQFSLDNADEEIFWINSEARILDANSLACKALGYSKEELVRLSVADIDPVFLSENWADHWQELKEKGSLRFESAHRTRDGRVYPTEILANYFEYEGHEYNCAFVRDITEHKQLEEDLKRQAHIDFLTGLCSRGHFMEQSEVELSRAIRYQSPFSLLMMDVDFFKQVNDTHGHKVGDYVLKKLAEICRSILRDVDVIGRIGGEEFAILLPETDKDEAIDVAERLRGAVANEKVPLSAGGLPLHFTVSIGLVSLASKDDNMDVLFNLADKALYEAKNSGRNRVCVAEQ